MILDQKTKEPYLNVWFGNFYKPAYDDEAFVCEAIALLQRLGFQSVLLDAKAWEDFRERFEGGEASQYVKMQEFMQQELARQGMSHVFLSLYLNGDNLYPNIRFSPPIYGESVVNPDGSDGKWYRYWSPKAKDSMVSHVAGLLRCYGEGYARIEAGGETRKPMCSMWDPIVAPSFDQEGRERYLTWLEQRYQGNITRLNEAYGLQAETFLSLRPEEYWFSCRYPQLTAVSEADVENRTPCFRVMADNKRWQSEELELYFAEMEKRLKAVDPSLFLCPDLAQWGYFLNVDGAMLSGVGMADLWDTAVRGIDLYRLAPYVDAAHFISVPVTPAGDPDCYVTACHHSMMRNMNRGRDFIGGIYWGRFLYQDLYAWLTPEETIGTIAASGACGYSSYGMCGLDDGGVLHRMPEAFCDSLAAGNAWAKAVIPRLGERKAARAAILFPSAMALYETMGTAYNRDRRMDLLGWYKACCDYGVDVDILDGTVWKSGGGKQYQVLILPADSCYLQDADPELEAAILTWVREGGTLLHGPEHRLAERVFGLRQQAHEKDAFSYTGKSGIYEKGMLTGRKFAAWQTETEAERIASWLSDGSAAIAGHRVEQGAVYSLGFSYGTAYTDKIAPHVPREQKNEALYPLQMLQDDPVKEMLEQALGEALPVHRGIERAAFANGEVRINHTSYPHRFRAAGKLWFSREAQCREAETVQEWVLPPRTAVFIENERR